MRITCVLRKATTVKYLKTVSICLYCLQGCVYPQQNPRFPLAYHDFAKYLRIILLGENVTLRRDANILFEFLQRVRVSFLQVFKFDSVSFVIAIFFLSSYWNIYFYQFYEYFPLGKWMARRRLFYFIICALFSLRRVGGNVNLWTKRSLSYHGFGSALGKNSVNL